MRVLFYTSIVMQIIFSDHHFQLSLDQKTFLEEKINHLKKYGEKINDESTRIRVDVGINKIKNSDKNITMQVTMYLPHAIIRAEVYATAIEEAIDLALEKLKKQLDRYKQKQNRRDRTGKWIPSSTLEEIHSIEDTGFSISQIAKRKILSNIEPLHEEEALEQLELLGHEFYAFINAETDCFNVIYRREDGSYGILDFRKESPVEE